MKNKRIKHTLEELVICILVQPHVVQWTRPVYYKTIRNNQKFKEKEMGENIIDHSRISSPSPNCSNILHLLLNEKLYKNP